MTFTKKPLRQSPTIGEYLHSVRMERGFSLAEIAARTKISERYLEAIEANIIHRLPSMVFRKHYLRRYAEELRLRWDDVAVEYQKELIMYQQSMQSDDDISPFGRHNVHSAHAHERRALLIPQYLKIGGIVLVVLCIVLYLLWGLLKFVSPPELVIIEPSEDQIVHERLLSVRGTTASGVLVAINDQSVNVNAEGDFNAEIPLREGLNVLRISAKTKHSSTQVLMRNILYTP